MTHPPAGLYTLRRRTWTIKDLDTLIPILEPSTEHLVQRQALFDAELPLPV